MSDFKARFPINIRFSDFDSLGHVNNAVYLTYLEEARVKYFETVIEHHKEIDWWENGIILANISIDFRKPILSSILSFPCFVKRILTPSNYLTDKSIWPIPSLTSPKASKSIQQIGNIVATLPFGFSSH